MGVAIVTGGYPPGGVLPGEIGFAERFGVSRGVIREAIRTLAAKGLVESRTRTGTRVRDRRHAGSPASIACPSHPARSALSRVAD